MIVFILTVSGLIYMMSKKPIKKNVSINSDFSNYKVYQSLIPKILDYLSQLKLDVDFNFILSIIKQESGKKFSYLKHIRGDNNTAFGLMQVRQAALTDVNKKFNTDYDLIDLDDVNIGLFAGIGYLKVIYDVMLQRNESITYDKLAYYYNSGYGQKKSSEAKYNATVYANSVLDNYDYFSNLG